MPQHKVTIWRGGSVSVAVLVLMMAAVCALLLALPGQTVVTKYLNDLFIFLDGAHRIAWGQVPHRDFHTALGPLAFYVPAAGYWLSGSFGAALPLGMALILLALAPILAHVASSRLHPAIALPFSALVILVLAVPINLGEGVTALSFVKFYNRIGWAALAILLVMYLRPEPARPRQQLLDALCAAALTLVMIYTKVTYGLVALAFLAFMLLDPRQRRWAGLAIGLVLAAGLLVEAVWRGSMAYAEALALAYNVSGGLRESWGRIVDHFLANFADYVLLILIAGIALARTRSLRDLLFYGFCAVTGFLLVRQNFQVWGIITLLAAAAVAAQTILRTSEAGATDAARRWSHAAGAKLFYLAMVLPTIVHCAIALGLHVGVAVSGRGEELTLPNVEGVRLVSLWTPADRDVVARYFDKVQDGAASLASLDPPPSRVVVLDFSNPFSAGLDLEPATGDAPWLHWNRNVDAANYVPADALLGNAELAMEAVDPGEASNLQILYNSYLTRNFELVRRTADWRIYRRRGSDDPSRRGE